VVRTLLHDQVSFFDCFLARLEIELFEVTGYDFFSRPFFHEKSDEHTDLNFLQVDVDEMADLAGDCGITAMPTFQVYNDKGAKVDEFSGASKDKLTELITKHKPAQL
jgi:hypothetical protein